MLQFFVADPDPGPGAFLSWIRVQNGKIRIRDKHPGSATLLQSVTLIINLLNFNFLVKIWSDASSDPLFRRFIGNGCSVYVFLFVFRGRKSGTWRTDSR